MKFFLSWWQALLYLRDREPRQLVTNGLVSVLLEDSGISELLVMWEVRVTERRQSRSWESTFVEHPSIILGSPHPYGHTVEMFV